MIPFHFAMQLSSKHFLIQLAFRLSACSDGSGTSSPRIDLRDFKMVRFILSRFFFCSKYRRADDKLGQVSRRSLMDVTLCER